MQHDSSLLAEAQRQFLICSACRYCESYCATFPAIEARTEYTASDAAYIANVCHDCRACYQACMYTAPHEFAVDLPKLLAEVRLETYRERSLPPRLRALLGSVNGRFVIVSAVIAAVLLLGSIAATGRWAQFGDAGDAPGAFYRIVPFLWMLVPALVLGGWAVIALAGMARSLIRDVAPDAKAKVRDVIGAWRDGLNLTYMNGGGEGCYYPPLQRPSQGRRVFHVTLVIGIGLAFLATCAGAFMQDVLGQEPPFPYISVPVISGALGGLAILLGAGGLAALKIRAGAKAVESRGMLKLEVVFLWTLLAVALTGLLLLAFRGTALLGTLLVVHLSTVAALFVSAPYGKFVHVPLRLAALLIFHMEEARGSSK